LTAKRAPAAKKKPKHYTKAQNKAFRTYLRRHPPPRSAAQAAHGGHAGPVAGPVKGPATKRGAVGLALGSEWITGSNDELPSCVATAVANSLLAVTGIRVSDADVLELHELAGGGDGVSISDTLTAVMEHGIAGYRPRWIATTSTTHLTAGGILGLTDGKNDHAVTVTPEGLISWGALMGAGLTHEWWIDGEIWHIEWTPGA
jgi:hypothetical protein